MEATLLNRITNNPSILTGKPVIRGMRISVEQILKMLARGISNDDIIKEFPMLEIDDTKHALYMPLIKFLLKNGMINTSKLKIIIDVGVGRIIEEWLAQEGFNVIANLESKFGNA